MNGELLALLVQIVPELGAQLEKLRGKGKVKDEELNAILMAQLIQVHKDAFRKLEIGVGQVAEKLDNLQKQLNRIETAVA